QGGDCRCAGLWSGHGGLRAVAMVSALVIAPRRDRRCGHGQHGDAADDPSTRHARSPAGTSDFDQYDVLHGRAAVGRNRGGGGWERRHRWYWADWAVWRLWQSSPGGHQGSGNTKPRSSCQNEKNESFRPRFSLTSRMENSRTSVPSSYTSPFITCICWGSIQY